MSQKEERDYIREVVNEVMDTREFLDIIQTNLEQAAMKTIDAILNHSVYMSAMEKVLTERTSQKLKAFLAPPESPKKKKTPTKRSYAKVASPTPPQIPQENAFNDSDDSQNSLNMSSEEEVPKKAPVRAAPKRGRRVKQPEILNASVSIPEVEVTVNKTTRGRQIKPTPKVAEKKLDVTVRGGKSRKSVLNQSTLNQSVIDNPTPAMLALMKKRAEAEAAPPKPKPAKRRRLR